MVQGWLLSPRLAVGAEEAWRGGGAGEQPAKRPGVSHAFGKEVGGLVLALGSVLSASGQALNQEGREARAGPDLLGAAIRILAS